MSKEKTNESGRILVLLVVFLVLSATGFFLLFKYGWIDFGPKLRKEEQVVQKNEVRKTITAKPYHQIHIDAEDVFIDGVKRPDFVTAIPQLLTSHEVELTYTESARAYLLDKVRFTIDQNSLVVVQERMKDPSRP